MARCRPLTTVFYRLSPATNSSFIRLSAIQFLFDVFRYYFSNKYRSSLTPLTRVWKEICKRTLRLTDTELEGPPPTGDWLSYFVTLCKNRFSQDHCGSLVIIGTDNRR